MAAIIMYVILTYRNDKAYLLSIYSAPGKAVRGGGSGGRLPPQLGSELVEDGEIPVGIVGACPMVLQESNDVTQF